MAGHLRVNSPWSQLGIFLGLFGLAFFLGYVLMAIMALSMGLAEGSTADGFDWSNPKVVSGLKLIQAISSVVIFLLPAVIFARIVSNRQPFSFLGMRPAPVKLMYALSVVGIILAFPFVFWLGEINQLIPLPQWMGDMEKEAAKQMQQFLRNGSLFDVFVNVLIIAFLPAICEEVCFRGALQRVIIHITKSPWRGIILTSILFSALHLQFQGFLPRLALGIFLGAIYWYSGSLWLSILAHFVANGAQVIAVSYAPEYIEKNPPVPIYLAILSVLITIGIIWIFKAMSTANYRNVYGPEDMKRNNEFLV